MEKPGFWRDVKQDSLKDVFPLITGFSSVDEQDKHRDWCKPEKQVTDISLISRAKGWEQGGDG